ncbi:MAG: O-antigen ligase family protein [Chloroflexi bacterium]|nr:O-antigen ligase family protein [Chloroflexota bacterium]
MKLKFVPSKLSIWLYILLFSYYPFHPTIYALITKSFPSIPSPLVSVWQDILILLIFLFALYSIISKSPGRISIVDIFVFAWILISIPSAIISGNIIVIVYGFRLTYLPVLLYFGIRFLPFRDFTGYKPIINTIINISLVVIILGIVIYFIIPFNIIAKWYQINDFTIGYYQNIRRMDSIFWSPVVFGSLMSMNAILSFSLLLSEKRKNILGSKYIWLTILFTFGCLMSLSRGAWGSELIGIIIIALLNISRKLGIATIAGISLVIITIVLLVYSGSSNPFIRHIESTFSTTQYGTGQIPRAAAREAALNNIMQNPFGVGLGQAGYVASWFSETQQTRGGEADNWYLKLVEESGIVGAIVFLVLMISFIIYTLIGYINIPFGGQKYIILASLAIIIGVLFQCYGSNVWDFYMLNSIYWTLMGLSMNLITRSYRFRLNLLSD